MPHRSNRTQKDQQPLQQGLQRLRDSQNSVVLKNPAGNAFVYHLILRQNTGLQNRKAFKCDTFTFQQVELFARQRLDKKEADHVIVTEQLTEYGSPRDLMHITRKRVSDA